VGEPHAARRSEVWAQGTQGAPQAEQRAQELWQGQAPLAQYLVLVYIIDVRRPPQGAQGREGQALAAESRTGVPPMAGGQAKAERDSQLRAQGEALANAMQSKFQEAILQSAMLPAPTFPPAAGTPQASAPAVVVPPPLPPPSGAPEGQRQEEALSPLKLRWLEAELGHEVTFLDGSKQAVTDVLKKALCNRATVAKVTEFFARSVAECRFRIARRRVRTPSSMWPWTSEATRRSWLEATALASSLAWDGERWAFCCSSCRCA